MYIDATAADDLAFIERVEAIVAHAVNARPARLLIVRIDNWFGHRWVGFAGKYKGALGIHHGKQLTVPPFVPARVIAQSCFRWSPVTGEYVREECAGAIHVRQHSAANLKKWVGDAYPGTALVWFSDKSERLGRGSVMAYVPTPEGHVAWYADLNVHIDWAAARVVGLPERELAALSAR